MEPVNAGLLNISKPSGVTSYWVVNEVKRALGIRKVGHCGTLDPLAEGVLLILFGQATKLQAGLMAGKKTYRTRMLLGVTTDTGDITGKVRQTLDAAPVQPAHLEKILERFTGEIMQIPPMYSALKVGGRRLYDLARKGEEVERQPRPVTVYRIKSLSYEHPRVTLEIECSRGTYIRTLVEDIGAALGCGATVEFLSRENVGNFSRENALDGRALRGMTKDELLGKAYPVEEVRRRMDL